VKITYDRAADAAYIHLIHIKAGEAKKTYSCDPAEINGTINLDFNASNQLIGVEVLDASKRLPTKLLETAEIIG
jgi:uncharacterized protein YuzE